MIEWKIDTKKFHYRLDGFKKDKIVYLIDVSLINDKVYLYDVHTNIRIKESDIVFKSSDEAIEELKNYVKYLERSKKINNLVKILKESNG